MPESNNPTPVEQPAKPAAPISTEANPEIANAVPAANPSQTADESSIASSSTSGVTSSGMREGDNLFEVLAANSGMEYVETTNFADGMKRKISCFFVDKATMSKSETFYLVYGREVKNLSIEQNLANYGITGSVDITDITGSITSIVNGQSNFYFVVCIMEITKEKENMDNGTINKHEEGYMTQPYVFEIEDVEVVSPDGALSKMYRLKLIDLISATLKKVSYGNLLLEYPSFINANNFVELYQTVLDYASTIICLNHNKKYHIDTEILFVDDVTDSINEILKAVLLMGIPISITCYELLNKIHRAAAREIEPPSNFKGEIPGNVLLPICLQDEIPDVNSFYKKYFNRDNGKSVITDLSFSGGGNSISAKMIKRELTAKCILMPFAMAFNSGEESLIYENINPRRQANGDLEESENIFLASNGVAVSPISDNVDMEAPNSVTGLLWKNLALLSDTPNGATNMLVYFNWIYEFYKAAFLNDGESNLSRALGKSIKPATDPHFHRAEVANLTGGDNEKFAKINANTVILKSTDTVKEALYHVGKVLKSFIYMNSLFGFKIKGSILRHPGEIIKINSTAKDKESDSSTGVIGGVESHKNNFVLAYTTAISHVFNDNQYDNVIYASKICTIG